MRVIGIHDSHDASVCLVEDGQVLLAIEEERLSGIKNYNGFPSLALAEILKRSKFTISDIDYFAVSGKHRPPVLDREAMVQHFKNYLTIFGTSIRVARHTPIYGAYKKIARKRREGDLKRAGIPLDKVFFVEHHLAHAAAAYFGSPWRENVLVLTCDGAGDGLCATVNIGEGNNLIRKADVPESSSIGWLYSVVTFMLGMMPIEHEYKLMGMAPYAPSKGANKSYMVFKELMGLSRDNSLIWRRKQGVPNTYYIFNYLREKLAFHRFDWICAGLQRWTEEILADWVRNCIDHFKIEKVALGGGVFMNVKANKKIAELPGLRDLFIFPSCGDESNSIGAALWIYSQNITRASEEAAPIGANYWGMDYSDEEMKENLLDEKSIDYNRHDDIERETAKLLAVGEVVARFKGKMEFGARALGNRSILADPSNKNIIKIINEMVKMRDFWMPFACSVLEDRVDDYFTNPKGIKAPYMMMSFDTTENWDQIAAGVHPYDLTVRPQVVYKAWNEDYYRLIKSFETITGRGAILNTSFNIHGEPIVGTPMAALDSFMRSGLNYLAIGNYMVQKKTRVLQR